MTNNMALAENHPVTVVASKEKKDDDVLARDIEYDMEEEDE